MSTSKKGIKRINVDKAIKIYNEKNPTLLPMTRNRLAEEVGYKAQIFSDWKAGKTPNWITGLDKMMTFLQCDLETLVEREND